MGSTPPSVGGGFSSVRAAGSSPRRLVATGNEVLVPFAIDISFTNVTTGDTETFAAVKGRGTNPNAVTCTIDFTDTDPVTGEQFHIEGSVLALITPAR
jgi:hypothetical protein